MEVEIKKVSDYDPGLLAKHTWLSRSEEAVFPDRKLEWDVDQHELRFVFLLPSCSPSSDPDHKWVGANKPGSASPNSSSGHLSERSSLLASGQCYSDGDGR